MNDWIEPDDPAASFPWRDFMWIIALLAVLLTVGLLVRWCAHALD